NGNVYPSGTFFEPPATWFTTQWADVTYFVRPNGDSTGGMPLYSLYRRQNLLVGATLQEQVPYTTGGPTPRPLGLPNNYLEVSSWQMPSPPPGYEQYRVNSPNMITAPCRRFGVNPADPAGTYPGAIPRFVDQLGGNLD